MRSQVTQLGILCIFPWKKVTPREKHPRENKVATSEDTPPWGQRMKNPCNFPPYSPSPSEDDENDKNDELKGDAGAEDNVESNSESTLEEDTLENDSVE